MNDLSNSIYTYYRDHFEELSFDKQFHFASRLYLWGQDPTAGRWLRELRPTFTADGDPEQAVREVVVASRDSMAHGSKNAAELRRPYFERYPQLRTYVTVLFRLNFLKTIYNIDACHLFYQYFPEEEVERHERQLLADREGVSILSTHAINFFYLYERLIKHQEETLDPEVFLRIGHDCFDRANVLHLQLLIYLYTHCIIGESRFYARALPSRCLEDFRTMLEELNQLLETRFQDINLDNKFEFLVCCRMVGYKSTVERDILAEASQSIAGEGQFIIDRHNNNPQVANVTLDKSEHRNILFIMANTRFSPLQP